jgi:hypothetical protein
MGCVDVAYGHKAVFPGVGIIKQEECLGVIKDQTSGREADPVFSKVVCCLRFIPLKCSSCIRYRNSVVGQMAYSACAGNTPKMSGLWHG